MKAKRPASLVALCLFATGLALAKLPPLTDEQKAKAEEMQAIAAAVAKQDAESLAKAQDRVASRYMQEQKAKGISRGKSGAVGAASATDVPAVVSVVPATPEQSAVPPDALAPVRKK